MPDDVVAETEDGEERPARDWQVPAYRGDAFYQMIE
jgi:hypothetical protein